MENTRCLQRIRSNGIIAVVRAEEPGKALKLAEAVKLGGIDIIEITMTVPDAPEVICELGRAFPDGEIVVGAGTVLDRETARAALLKGAEFIVSPHLSSEVIHLCNSYRKLSMPGVGSVTEVFKALEAGADMVKIFPGNVLGAGFIKAVLGPLPHALMVPTGGVSLENLDQWVESGCVAVGVGGRLTEGAEKGNYQQVTATARQFVEGIKKARKKVGQTSG